LTITVGQGPWRHWTGTGDELLQGASQGTIAGCEEALA